MSYKKRVAIIGTGKIGIDLLYKIRRSDHLHCDLVVGRNRESEGIKVAESLDLPVSVNGIDDIVARTSEIDILFDATSALSHIEHWNRLQDTGIRVVDMTPSHVGVSVIPPVNLDAADTEMNVNMISCGGQSSIPIVAAVSDVVNQIDYVEVVSSIASKSAGPATRLNLDEYVATTERGVSGFSKTKSSKVILILNPATPPVYMQTTISFMINDPPMDLITQSVDQRAKEIQSYVPGYEVIIRPQQIDNKRVMVMVKVTGSGDYLPKFAGNLDIINCAAVAVAERMALAIDQERSSPPLQRQAN